MQMMQLFAQRGGVPRAVFKDARIGDIDCILKYTINALTWDDFRLVCRPDNPERLRQNCQGAPASLGRR